MEREAQTPIDHNDASIPESETPSEDMPPRVREHWQIQKQALKEKFPEGWNPRKKLSPDALDGIRALNQQFPDVYTTTVLAKRFEVSPEAIRRILKSKWKPSSEEEEERQERWFNRGKQVWSRWAELGKRPPTKWRQEGIDRQRQPWDSADREEWQSRSQGKQMRLAARRRLSEDVM